MTDKVSGISLVREHLGTHTPDLVRQFLPQGVLVRCGTCNQLLEIYGNLNLTDAEELELLGMAATEVSSWTASSR